MIVRDGVCDILVGGGVDCGCGCGLVVMAVVALVMVVVVVAATTDDDSFGNFLVGQGGVVLCGGDGGRKCWW